jgi:hypothetical protein
VAVVKQIALAAVMKRNIKQTITEASAGSIKMGSEEVYEA